MFNIITVSVLHWSFVFLVSYYGLLRHLTVSWWYGTPLQALCNVTNSLYVKLFEAALRSTCQKEDAVRTGSHQEQTRGDPLLGRPAPLGALQALAGAPVPLPHADPHRRTQGMTAADSKTSRRYVALLYIAVTCFQWSVGCCTSHFLCCFPQWHAVDGATSAVPLQSAGQPIICSACCGEVHMPRVELYGGRSLA